MPWPAFNVTGNPFIEAAVLSTLRDMPRTVAFRPRFKRRGFVAKRRFARRTVARRTFRYTRRRRFTRRRVGVSRRRTRRRVTLRRKVAKLSRLARSGIARHKHKYTAYGRATATENAVVHTSSILSRANLETAMTNLRYYDPATPGTLVTAGGGTGTFNRTIHVEGIYHQAVYRNNSLGPCTVRCYFIVPKHETNVTPETAMNNGVTDQVVTGATDNTSLLIYPTDLDAFNAEWKVVKMRKFRLAPGSTASMSGSTGPFDYNPSIADVETDAYHPRWGAAGFLTRVEGPIAEDSSVSTQEGVGPARIDLRIERVFRFTYDAGVTLNDISISDGVDAFTNAPTIAMLRQAVD